MLHILNERRTFSGLPWKSHELAAVRELHVSVPWHGNGRNTSKFFNYFLQALGRSDLEDTFFKIKDS